MYISYLRLLNFRGIYSGIGKEKIEIEFPNPSTLKSKIVLLMGGNGSGKSTVLSSLQPFASSFDGRDESLIRTGFNGEKEIHFIKGKDKYEILHQYIRVGSSGKVLSSPSTKCFITKNGKELNENGGVKTFKDIVKQELGIEESFFKIGRVASTAINFVDLPAGERKDFIIKQLPDTSEWLEAYENAKDKCNMTNKQITSLALDLQKFEEEEVLKERYSSITAIVEKYKGILTTLNSKLAVYKSKIEEFEKDEENRDALKNTEKFNRLNSELDSLQEDIINCRKKLKCQNPEEFDELGSDEVNSKLTKFSTKLGVKENLVESLDESHNSLIDTRNSYESQKKKAESQKSEMISFDETEEELLKQKTSLQQELSETNEILKPILSSIKDIDNFDEIKKISSRDRNSIINRFNIIMEKLNGFFSNVNGERDYLLSLEPTEMNEAMLEEFLTMHGNNIEKLNKEYREKYQELETLKAELAASLRLDKKVPKDCNVKSCPFRNGLLTEEGKKVNTRKIDNLENDVLPKIEANIEKSNTEKEVIESSLDMIKSIMVAKEMLSSDTMKLFTKKYFNTSSIDKFINSLKSVTMLDIFSKIKNTCSLVDDYIEGMDKIDRINEKIKNIESKVKYLKNNQSVLKQLDEIIESSQKKIDKITEDIEIKKTEILTTKQEILRLNNTIRIVNEYYEYVKQYENNVEEIEKLEDIIEKFKKKSEKYSKWKEEKDNLLSEINENSEILKEHEKEQKELFASLSKLKDIKEKYNNLKTVYAKQIAVRDTADPKKGFPLYYLRNFMNDIENLANDLFEVAFGEDKFYISFQIDEKVFKVNIYKADGDILEDAKLASDGERSLVKLIISLSLLSYYTQYFPIMALDEVDAVLDDTYRGSFASIIEGQIKTLGLNQVFMISHNENFRNEEIPVCLFPRNTFNKNVEKNMIISDFNKKKI